MRRSLFLTAPVAAMLLVPTGIALASTTTAEITGQVFVDLDGDGARDADEPGVAGVPVTLRTAAVVADAVTTDASGMYGFDVVVAGTYEIALGTPAGLAVTTDGGVAAVDVAAGESVEVTAFGLGTTLASGPDLAVDVRPAEDAATEFTWEVAVFNLGDESVDGPIGLRIVLDGDHDVTAADGPGWSCDVGSTIATCESTGGLDASDQLPPLAVTTTSTGMPGTALQLTGTVDSASGGDDAPLNDEDSATTLIGTEVAVGDDDGGSTDDGADGDAAPELRDTGIGAAAAATAALASIALGGGLVLATRRR